MEKTFNAVELIQTISNKLRHKKIKNIAAVENEIASLGEYLGTDQMQTIIFVAIFEFCASGSSMNADDMARYYDCSVLDIVAHKKDFDQLLFYGLIEKSARELESTIFFTRTDFRVPAVIFEAILVNKPLTEAKAVQSELDHFDMVKQIGECLENRDREDITTATFLAQAKELEESYSSCEFITKTRELLPGIADRVLFYDICKDNFFDGNFSDLEDTLKDLYDHRKQTLKAMKEFLSESSVLQQSGLVKCWEDNLTHKLTPSKAGYELLLGEYTEVKIKKSTGLDKFEFVKAVSDCIVDKKFNNFGMLKLKNMVLDLEYSNRDLPTVKEAQKLLKSHNDRIFFYSMCNDSMFCRTCLERTLADIYEKPQWVMEETVKWKNGEHPLQTLGLAEMGEESFFGGTKVELTEDGRELFLQEDAEKYKKKDKTNDILSVNKIKAKNMFYSPSLKKQIDFLSNSLQQSAFEKLQKRLDEQGMPKGVAAIFYGSPGTGKTETVYQLAKSTGRDVMQVDISEMKSSWYGESQKLVKEVFTKYERLCKKSKRAPILLFNEADAVFSKRMENKGTSVDQTENAIQNIILEQMEILSGILIATTNLEGNLDPAFERRFLFKVKFEKLSTDAKVLIWRDKLPEITSKDAEALANEFDFTGGEIDNIVRKVTMNQVLNDDEYSLAYLKELCSQEHLTKRCGNIGYK
ncbi:MAG: AAA family ATPase [Bacteroidales bacterium]|nr:AAA family ATPase [Bacteroidales bacterium]